ncbi:MAG: type 2 isopentenyl-diphosphate Delta-isomerase [Candidatus Hydrothermarchaeota archaeon]
MGKKDMEKRKLEHINICLKENVESRRTTGFEDVHFVHECIPNINFGDIDCSCELFGKKLSAPIIVAGMTGGHKNTKKINKNIARAVQDLGLGMGVGSQRPGMEEENLMDTYKVRDEAPDVLLFANLGVSQFMEYTSKEANKAVEEIEADVLAIHFNPLHEVVQPEGNVETKGLKERLKRIIKEVRYPCVAKETGAGISYENALELDRMGFSGIDVGGLGGTSFSAVETYRAKESPRKKRLGEVLWDWGIPTAISTFEVRRALPDTQIISTGGIRTGLDIAKALALGANAAGIALPVLERAIKGEKQTKEYLEEIILQLKAVMYLLNAETIKDLKSKHIVVCGKTREYIMARGFEIG